MSKYCLYDYYFKNYKSSISINKLVGIQGTTVKSYNRDFIHKKDGTTNQLIIDKGTVIFVGTGSRVNTKVHNYQGNSTTVYLNKIDLDQSCIFKVEEDYTIAPDTHYLARQLIPKSVESHFTTLNEHNDKYHINPKVDSTAYGYSAAQADISQFTGFYEDYYILLIDPYISEETNLDPFIAVVPVLEFVNKYDCNTNNISVFNSYVTPGYSSDILNVYSHIVGISNIIDGAYKAILLGGFTSGLYRTTDDYNRPLGTDGLPYGTDWEENVTLGIIPNSVWTIKFRPISNPEHMVYLGNNLWGDISLMSLNNWDHYHSYTAACDFQNNFEGFNYTANARHFMDSLRTRGSNFKTDYVFRNSIDTMPTISKDPRLEWADTSGSGEPTAYESLSNTYAATDYPVDNIYHLNWFGMNEASYFIGKRLPTYDEYYNAAIGTPNKPSYANVEGTISNLIPLYSKASISSYNVVGLVGGTWKYLNHLSSLETAVSGAWRSTALYKEGGFHNTILHGGMYLYGVDSIRSLAVGGNYQSSNNAGLGALTTEFTPQESTTSCCSGWFVSENV